MTKNEAGLALVTPEWIARIVDDERRRDDARLRVTEEATRKANLVMQHGRTLLDELRATIVRDVEIFQNEFPGDSDRRILFEDIQPDGGFAVRKPEFPSVVLSVVPRFQASLVNCEYRFASNNGLPPRETRFELSFTSDGTDGKLQITHRGTQQVFATADVLSEYLLVPVFTGRLR